MILVGSANQMAFFTLECTSIRKFIENSIEILKFLITFLMFRVAGKGLITLWTDNSRSWHIYKLAGKINLKYNPNP